MGKVVETTVPIKKYIAEINGKKTPIVNAPLKDKGIIKNLDDPEKSEYLVRVEWIKAVPKDQAYWEKGMYDNQNTVTKLRNRFTLERLIKHFGLED